MRSLREDAARSLACSRCGAGAAAGEHRDRNSVSMGTEWSFCNENRDAGATLASRAWCVSSQSSGVVHVSDMTVRRAGGKASSQ